jgi:Putative peptidoglycan binding domain
MAEDVRENIFMSMPVRFLSVTAILSILCAFAGMGATTGTKTTSAKKVTSSKKAAPKSIGKTVASSKSKSSKGKKPPPPAATWRTRQQNPTPDRYKEIQQALVDKGYLKGEPSGVWDADSVNALARFQGDQKITPTGKINSPSLIGLGLGAKSAGAPEAAPLPQTSPPASVVGNPPPN